MSTDFLNQQCSAQSVGTVDTLVSTLVQALLVAQCAISKPEYWPSDYADAALQPGGLDDFDFVVVGAGSAGSVIASRLSENPDCNVLVLEQGDNPPQESEVPPLLFTIQHSEFTYNYWTESTGKASLAFKNNASYWPRGKAIGGSGSINGMLYVRGNRKDYDDWQAQGNPGWGWADVLPYFEKSVRPAGNDNMPQGYVTVNEFGRFNIDVQEMIYAGAQELGSPQVTRFEEDTTTGYTNLPGTIQNGQRMSTGKSYLGKVSDRPNLRVIKNAQVTRINFDASGKNVKSVNFVLRNQHKLRVSVKKELVLSAGSIESPKLLMLSGVGLRQHLSCLKLPVIHDLPVGNNLQDHLVVPLFFKLDASTAVPITQEETLDNIYNYLIHRRGPFSSHGTLSLTGFVNTVEGSNSLRADIQYHHSFIRHGDMASLGIYTNGIAIQEFYASHLQQILSTGNLLIIYVILLHPKSIGSLRLRSAYYKDAPKIFANYLEEPEDMETLLRGIRRLMNMEQTQAFVAREAEIQHLPIEECDQYEFKSDDYWRCYMRYLSSTVYHQTGTVKMGPKTDPTACVNSRLKVHGVRNLRVVDASIMPKMQSANTNAATIMIAEKAADFIAEDWNAQLHKKLEL